jgi:Fe-S-cluster formation regulator IscX/YfhJ
MASVNKKTITPAPVTHGGTVASRISPFLQLRRSVMATMLFEDNFYESGDSVVERIKTLIPQCDPQKVANLAIDTRKLGIMKSRSGPTSHLSSSIQNRSRKILKMPEPTLLSSTTTS